MKPLSTKIAIEKEQFEAYSQSGVVDIHNKVKDFRYEEEVTCSIDQSLDKLNRRLKQVELVVEDHIKALHGKGGLKYFNDEDNVMPLEEKINYLITKQAKIPIEGEHGPRLRLVGITQSYDVFDSVQFKKVKAIKLKLETNQEYTLADETLEP